MNPLHHLHRSTRLVLAGLTALLAGGAAQAGVPFVGLDGTGGVAFNPLAYLAGTPTEGSFIAKPTFGAWHVSGLADSKIDWSTYGLATSLGKRVEVSYGYETVDIEKVQNIHKNTIGAKLLVVNENAGGAWVPAVSVGVKRKSTSYAAATKKDSFDYYAVATKLITQTGAPLLLSVGLQSTQEQVTGVIGFNNERALIYFGNVDVIPVSWLALGAEYRTGPDYGAAGGHYKDANYFNLHAAYLASKQFSLALAYVNTGTNTFNGGKSGSSLGFGDGFVLSAHYAF